MSLSRLALTASAWVALASTGVFAAFGENIIEVKLTLPNGETYIRGDSDPVANLVVAITLTNTTKKENLNKEIKSLPNVSRINGDEFTKLTSMTREQQKALVEQKKGTVDVGIYPPNQESLGYPYVEPALGPYENVDLIITRLPDEGEVVPEGAKPRVVSRDNKPDHVEHVDRLPTLYLAAGETSPAFPLDAGKYYLINEPGLYSVKAVMKTIGDNTKPDKFAESNEEKFRVLPFKAIGQKIDEVRENIQLYERGVPQFDYMLYQLKTDGPFDEIYSLQRIPVRGANRWEWWRICTVKPGTQPQLAQLGPKKLALLSVHAKGDAGLYTLDFSTLGPKIDSQLIPVKEGATPKLKVEGGVVSVE